MFSKILHSIMKIISDNLYAVFLSISLSQLGHGLNTFEFWIVLVSTVLLVDLKISGIVIPIKKEVDKAIKCLEALKKEFDQNNRDIK